MKNMYLHGKKGTNKVTNGKHIHTSEASQLSTSNSKAASWRHVIAHSSSPATMPI